MSSVGEIELLERVLLRLGLVDTDDQLEATVHKFLPPVMLKINSTQENVRLKVVEVLTHIKRRVTSRPLVQIPVDALLDQYKENASSPFFQNFAMIFISMGFPRLPIEQQTVLAPKVISCEGRAGKYQDKMFMMLLPVLKAIKVSSADGADRNKLLNVEDKPEIRANFLHLLQDVLLLPYGVTADSELPPGLSAKSFERIVSNGWRAEELEKIKIGIVEFACKGVFSNKETFILLVIGSADTRFSVTTPAIAELSKLTTGLDFSSLSVTMPLYELFSGNNSQIAEEKTMPCCARVRQKLLQYLVKCRGKGVNTPRGIQVIFEGLFGANTNPKCKILSLQFAQVVIKEGPYEVVSKVAKVILTGINKLIGSESEEANEVQIAAYAALAQLAHTCPFVVNQDLKIVLTHLNHLADAAPELHSSIRDALVAIAPSFGCALQNQNDSKAQKTVKLDGQHHLLLAMLSDNVESKNVNVQNVTSIFLTTCFPEYFAPARFLLLLVAGQRNSLHESIICYLYGVSKKDNVNYNMLTSVDHPEEVTQSTNQVSQEQRNVTLPSFLSMMRQVHEATQKRLAKNNACIIIGSIKLPYTLDIYNEILDYLRLCLWYSAGVRSFPGDIKYKQKLREYILYHYEDTEDNEIHQYVTFVQLSVEALRNESNLLCLYDILDSAPELFAERQVHLLEPLTSSLRDTSEVIRLYVAQVYGILLAYGLKDEVFDSKILECIKSLSQMSVEHKHGWTISLGHSVHRKIYMKKATRAKQNYMNWSPLTDSVKLFVHMLTETQWLLVLAALKSITLIGKLIEISSLQADLEPENIEIENNHRDTVSVTPTKCLSMYSKILGILKNTSVRPRLRLEAAACMGSLVIGDGAYFTKLNLQSFLALLKIQKDAALNISISNAIVCTLNGYDINDSQKDPEKFINSHCDDETFETFLNTLIHSVVEPNPHARQSAGVWLLAITKHCSHRSIVLKKKQTLQLAFTELLSDDNEFVQDVASRGLSLIFSLSDSASQTDLAQTLLDQLIGGPRKVKTVANDTELFADGLLGKTPTGGNITTYKELCSLASDLNKPDMIYQFMQLANHNAAWTSKLGAAFGFQYISKDSKEKMQPYLGKIIPRLYRYKYDPTPKIQNSMISIWDSIVTDSKEVVEMFYWEILRELLDNITFKEWRVRIACCLAIRDLLKRPNGLRLRYDDKYGKNASESPKGCSKAISIDSEDVPEPELKELWVQLFRVMDDIHEGTRLSAQGTCTFLSKVCVISASADHGKSGMAVATSILPYLLETGVTHTVSEVRKVSIKTVSDMIDSSGSLLTGHMPTLIPCLLKATGELESTKLSYLSTRAAADADAQELIDSVRAEAAKSQVTVETLSKCVRYIDYAALETMTPQVLQLIKTSINMGTKIACAHFICLITDRLNKEVSPLVGKYLAACFVGIKDRNAIVRKYYSSAIGHLAGVAKEQSIKNLFTKLSDLYMENSSNKAVALTIQSINKRHPELLKDYLECVLPLIYFAMHEEPNDDNKSTIDLWKDLWNDLCPGDAGIRMNLYSIIPQLESSLEDASWIRKAQAANGIQTVATRLVSVLSTEYRLRLIKLLLTGLQGRTFKGKERMLHALAALCKGLKKDDDIIGDIIESALRECRKEQIEYRIQALAALGDILETLEVDRFEELHQIVWKIVEKTTYQTTDDENALEKIDLTADERNKRAQIADKLRETVYETLGKSWPKNCIETQIKYQILFVEHCSTVFKNCTRSVQVSILCALTKFLERLFLLNNQLLEMEEGNQEKKAKIDDHLTRESTIKKLCSEIFSVVSYSAGVPHTKLKKEALNIILMLIKRFSEAKDAENCNLVKILFEENLMKFQRDSSPEVRCRINDIEEKLCKIDSRKV